MDDHDVDIFRQDETVRLSQQQLAKVLGVSSAYISRATHKRWKVHGHRVWEWAEWTESRRPDVDQRVRGYTVPRSALRKIRQRDGDEGEEGGGRRMRGAIADGLRALADWIDSGADQ